MPSTVNIFDSAKPQGGEFFKFKNVGDSVQGTYIDVRNGTDSFNNQQTIYVIQDAAGKIWNLGFRLSNAVVHERMNGIRLGQIIGFRYDEERDSKRNPGTKVKIIRIYADPKLVDSEWLAHQETIAKTFTKPTAEAVAADTAADHGDQEEDDFLPKMPDITAEFNEDTPATPTKNDALDAIRSLAKTKGLVTDAMSAEEADKAIAQFAELPLTEENLTKVIVKLSGYVSK